MKELVEYLAHNLVDNPDAVRVREHRGEYVIRIELRVEDEEKGKVIGREGKIARANRGRDPIYLFSALQRQLGYPEVPRPRRPDELEARVALLEQRIKELENRLKIAESEGGPGAADKLDLSDLTVKPEDTAGVPSGWGRPQP